MARRGVGLAGSLAEVAGARPLARLAGRGGAFLAAAAVAVSMAVAAPPDPSGWCSRAKAAEMRARLGGGLAILAADVDDPTDVIHVRLDLEVTPSSGRLSGVATTTIRSRVDLLSVVQFRLHSALTIAGVTEDGATAAWTRLPDGFVEVALPRAVPRDGTCDLAVRYSGVPPVVGSAYMVRSRSGAPEVATLSEPWFSYTWWPVKDDNRDKATVEVLLTVPAPLVAVSNGVLRRTDPVVGGKTRFDWVSEYPTAPYLVFFAVTNYTAFSDTFAAGGTSFPLQFWVYPEDDSPANRASLLRVRDALSVFTARFGPYPFAAEKYGIYEFPFGGGMEHQTCSGEGRFDEGLSAHELAHQWWGDLVTCATWSDIWLNEGFATYAEALWAEAEAGPSAAQVLRASMLERRPGNAWGSVYIPNPTTVSRVFSRDLTYLKGAWVLHMLRRVIGDEQFFAALGAYRDRYAFATATTEDFRAVVEDVASRDLAWFFDEWVYGVGLPAYQFGWREDLVAGKRYVEISLDQGATTGSQVFTMPLDVRLFTAGGSETRTVWSSAPRQHFLLPVDGPTDDVVLDPDGWVLTAAVQPQAFVPGPPRVVATFPESGATVTSGGPWAASVTFHEPVSISVDDVSLRSEANRTIPISLAYDPLSATARITPESPLGPGRYTLIVADSVRSAESGEALDGEIDQVGHLPSGDGIPGGSAVIGFAVVRAPRLVVRGGRR